MASAQTINNPHGNPMALLQAKHKQALADRDSNSRYCTLATLEQNDPSQVRMRTLVMREITSESCLMFVNRRAQKNISDLGNTRVEVLFFYPTLMSQFRMRGTLSLLPEKVLETHWQHKPYEAKLLDHFYARFQAQSGSIAGRKDLESGISQLEKEYPDPGSVPFIEDAIGLLVTANYLEIWQGNDSGIHDRQLYTLQSDGWHDETIVP